VPWPPWRSAEAGCFSLRGARIEVRPQLGRLVLLAFVLFFCRSIACAAVVAQEVSAQVAEPLPNFPVENPPFRTPHRFWDRENLWLFAGVGAARFLDYSSTLNMRRRGRQEIFLDNWVVDHHPLFAGVEVGGTAISVGASYLFHRAGHHQLERWVSFVHIGLATTGAVRNYSLKTAHPDPFPRAP
jgi:hypothetical protein